MEYRSLGRSGLRVSAFSFGLMTFGGSGMFSGIGDTKAAEARRQIDMCREIGINLFDTANMYSGGESEEVLAEALGTSRPDVLIATKFYGRTGPGPNDIGGSRHNIVNACEASLRRLKTDYIDLYQIHNQDLLTPAEETLRALDDLVRAGKVRYIGSSNHAGWTQMRALATSDRLGLNRYISQQIKYSLLDRDSESELLPMGVDEGVGALIWGPLSSGYLSGKYRNQGPREATRLSAGRLESTDTDQARAVVELLAEIAQDHPGASLSQVALNWVARKPGVSSILVGARTSEQLADNLAAAQWSLSDEEIGRLDEASAIPVRYPYQMHRDYGPERNPAVALLPMLPKS